MSTEPETTNAPRAVLWDMDGTLLDSAEYHWLSWRDTLASENVQLSYDQFITTFGQRNDTILRGWLGEDAALADMIRIGEAKEALYRELVKTRGVQLLPGVQRWLVRLNSAGWRQAVASAAPLLNVEAIVRALKISWCFDAIVSAEDVQRGKPDPQVFLLAAEKLGVSPERSIVVEDALAGVEGAHRAGMRAIAVRTSHPTITADVVVGTLDELSDGAFDELLRREVTGDG